MASEYLVITLPVLRIVWTRLLNTLGLTWVLANLGGHDFGNPLAYLWFGCKP